MVHLGGTKIPIYYPCPLRAPPNSSQASILNQVQLEPAICLGSWVIAPLFKSSPGPSLTNPAAMGVARRGSFSCEEENNAWAAGGGGMQEDSHALAAQIYVYIYICICVYV